MATFTANLIAFLAVDKYTPPFEDLEGFTNQDQYVIGILGGSTWKDLFQVFSFFVFLCFGKKNHKSCFSSVTRGHQVSTIYLCFPAFQCTFIPEDMANGEEV